MSHPNELDPSVPLTFPYNDPYPNDDAAKLAALRAAIDQADASPDVDGDIFEIISAKYDLNLDA